MCSPTLLLIKSLKRLGVQLVDEKVIKNLGCFGSAGKETHVR